MPSEIALQDLKTSEVQDLCLSIRPTSGGQTFAISHREAPNQYIQQGYLPTSLDPDAGSDSVQELFYTHSFLTLPYHQVHYLYQPCALCLLPRAFYHTAPDELWLSGIISPPDQQDELSYLAHELKDEEKVLLCASPAQLHHFLARMHPNLKARPYFWDQLASDRLESRRSPSRCLYLYLRQGHLDAYCLWRGETLFINSFTLVDTLDEGKLSEQVQFYLFSLWQSLELDGHTDRLHIYVCADQGKPTQLRAEQACHMLMARLEPYIRHTSYQTYYALGTH